MLTKEEGSLPKSPEETASQTSNLPQKRALISEETEDSFRAFGL